MLKGNMMNSMNQGWPVLADFVGKGLVEGSNLQAVAQSSDHHVHCLVM
jgi:hypothetical protein